MSLIIIFFQQCLLFIVKTSLVDNTKIINATLVHKLNRSGIHSKFLC